MKARMAWLCVLLCGLSHGFAQAPDPKTLLAGVKSAREQVPPSRLTLETTYQSELIRNEFVDIIEFDGELRRFARTSKVQSRPDFSRSVFDGKEALLQNQTQVSLYNLSGNFGSPLYDPRILGIAGVPSKTLTIQKCLWDDREVEMLGPEDIEGLSTWRVRMTYPDGSFVDRWIDVQHNFRVVKQQENWAAGSRTVRSWYENPEYQWLPSRVVTKNFGSNGGIVSRRDVTLLHAEANVKFPARTWTLAGLDLPPETVVVDTRSQTFGYWIDGRVVPAEEWNRRPAERGRAAAWNPTRTAVVAVLLLAVILPFVFFFRRTKA